MSIFSWKSSSIATRTKVWGERRERFLQALKSHEIERWSKIVLSSSFRNRWVLRGKWPTQPPLYRWYRKVPGGGKREQLLQALKCPVLMWLFYPLSEKCGYPVQFICKKFSSFPICWAQKPGIAAFVLFDVGSFCIPCTSPDQKTVPTLIRYCHKLRVRLSAVVIFLYGVAFKSKVKSNYFIVRTKVDQRAGLLSLPHLGIFAIHTR